MKKLQFVITLFMLLCSLGISQKSYASHGFGLELTYRHIAVDGYEFTAIFYRYCGGSPAAAPTTFQLDAFSPSLGVIHTNAAVLNIIPTPSYRLTGLDNCTRFSECIEQFVYRGYLSLNTLTSSPAKASDWVFSTELCCYASYVKNIGNEKIYASCGLNNLDFIDGNDSPFWHNPLPNTPGHLTDTIYNPPIRSMCALREYNFLQGTVEYEGDSLAYKLIPSLTSLGAPITYIGGFTSSNPMPLINPPGLLIDSTSGMITVKPANPAPSTDPTHFGLAMEVAEYRKDVNGVSKRIGYVQRNLMFMVERSTTCPNDDLQLLAKGDTINMNCETEIKLPISNPFQCSSVDKDASLVSLVHTASGLSVFIDSAYSNCQRNVSSQLILTLPTPLAKGNYILTLKNGKDGNSLVSECGLNGSLLQDTVWINVQRNTAKLTGRPDSSGGTANLLTATCGTYTLPIYLSEKVSCSSIAPDGSDFLVSNYDETVFYSATPIISHHCKGGLLSKVTLRLTTPIGFGDHKVVLKKGTDGNTVLNNCYEEADSSVILVRVPEGKVNLGRDLEYCPNNTFTAVLDAGLQDGSYLWNTGETTRYLIVDTAGIYYVDVDNGMGCIISDTVVVKEVPCVGIEEQAKGVICIHPNPTNGILHLSNVHTTEMLHLVILDQAGRVVFQDSFMGAAHRINLSALKKGTYFLKLSKEGEHIQSSKIVLY